MNRNFSNTKPFFCNLLVSIYSFAVRFEVLTAASMKIHVYRFVTHYKLRNGELLPKFLEKRAAFMLRLQQPFLFSTSALH